MNENEIIEMVEGEIMASLIGTPKELRNNHRLLMSQCKRRRNLTSQRVMKINFAYS